jgi:hypothetical protein
MINHADHTPESWTELALLQRHWADWTSLCMQSENHLLAFLVNCSDSGRLYSIQFLQAGDYSVHADRVQGGVCMQNVVVIYRSWVRVLHPVQGCFSCAFAQRLQRIHFTYGLFKN